MANLSKRSAGVRRLLQESAELSNDDSPDYSAQPLEVRLTLLPQPLEPI